MSPISLTRHGARRWALGSGTGGQRGRPRIDENEGIVSLGDEVRGRMLLDGRSAFQ